MKSLFAFCGCAVLSLMAGTSFAQQSYAESMADCSALYFVLGEHVVREGNVQRVEFATRAWAAAAVERGMARSDVIERVRSRASEWEKIDRFPSSQEFRDWASYCRSFARETGVEYDTQSQ